MAGIYCKNCGGEGWLPSQPSPATCPACNGTGLDGATLNRLADEAERGYDPDKITAVAIERCRICSERIRRQGNGWVHVHTGEAYCGCGDGSVAIPAVDG